jgi:hypothetical protein
MNTFRQVCASFALATMIALAATAVAVADPPADKGKDKGAQSDSYQQQGNSNKQGKGDGYDDKGRYGSDDSNHGQVVSECNHRANERNLKGQDRKEWTEWCEERGSRNNYDYRRYSTDRNCYQKADNKGLTGDKRRKFINDCLDRPNKY